LLNLVIEFLTVVFIIFFFLWFYDAFKWESNKFKRYDKMLHNDIIAYMSDKLDIKMFLMEDLHEEKPDERLERLQLEEENNLWKRIRFLGTSLKNDLYYGELWYHDRFEKATHFAEPVFRFKERNYFAKKKYQVMYPKKGLIHNFDIFFDKTTSTLLLSDRGYHLMNVNTKYQDYKIYSFEKYHGSFKFHAECNNLNDIADTQLKDHDFFYQNAFHYMVAHHKGGHYCGLEDPEQIRSVNHFIHLTRGKIELGGDVEVQRKPKDFTKRIPPKYLKMNQVYIWYIPKEVLSGYWNTLEQPLKLLKKIVGLS